MVGKSDAGPCNWADLSLTDLNEPFSNLFQDRYYSMGEGREESEYVFLQGNNLPEAWRAADVFQIGEIGFGTGLNFFVVLERWLESRAETACLRFNSFEKYPIHPDAFEQWVCQRHLKLARTILPAYKKIQPGWNKMVWKEWHVELNLFIGDASAGLESRPFQVDAWFYDGFVPAHNPELWNERVFSALAAHSKSGTTLSTYTASGFVRRGLEEAGFAMQKAKGFGRKRNMLRGVFKA
ncbi:MAG: hypothetical protein CR997_13340 [Acidobacteria bacterium]|nr:MAG: hypothetical protein CR997_13340 [Acidobacteriota bacterium]